VNISAADVTDLAAVVSRLMTQPDGSATISAADVAAICQVADDLGGVKTETDNTELLGKLRLLEWKFRDKFERATAKNKAVHDANVASVQTDPKAKLADYPFSEDEMDQMQLFMLLAQAGMAWEES
jgi:hypothetical protein